MAKERRQQGSNSLISHSSFAGSVGGGGSVAGAAGFDFEDIEIEGNLMKYVRMVQKGLVKEIDNQAVLAAYGIEINQPDSPTRLVISSPINNPGNTASQLAIANVSMMAEHAN